MGLRGVRCLSGLKGVRTDAAAIYIYIVIWLEHHWNKLYGFMGLWSKMLGEWTGMEWINTP